MVLGALERKLGRDSSEQSHGYLQQRLQYDAASEKLMDPEDKAVMMAWEGCVKFSLRSHWLFPSKHSLTYLDALNLSRKLSPCLDIGVSRHPSCMLHGSAAGS